MDNSSYLLSSVSNTLNILDILSKCKSMSLSEICRVSGYGKSSVFKMLYTLESFGFVKKNADLSYSLGMKFAHYGSLVTSRFDIIDIAKPYMTDLRDQFNQAVHLAILNENGTSTFIHKEVSDRAIQMSSTIGYTMDAYLSATGKMLLANLPDDTLQRYANAYNYIKYTDRSIGSKEELLAEIGRIRENGYSMDNEESYLGLTCIAMPIYGSAKKCVAAMSVSGGTQSTLDKKQEIINALGSVCSRISNTVF